MLLRGYFHLLDVITHPCSAFSYLSLSLSFILTLASLIMQIQLAMDNITSKAHFWCFWWHPTHQCHGIGIILI